MMHLCVWVHRIVIGHFYNWAFFLEFFQKAWLGADSALLVEARSSNSCFERFLGNAWQCQLFLFWDSLHRWTSEINHRIILLKSIYWVTNIYPESRPLIIFYDMHYTRWKLHGWSSIQIPHFVKFLTLWSIQKWISYFVLIFLWIDDECFPEWNFFSQICCCHLHHHSSYILLGIFRDHGWRV